MAMYKCKKGATLTGEIYGVQTNGIGSSYYRMDRTDAAIGFRDPSPQLQPSANNWTGGFSPFDDIMPWAGMVLVEDAEAGTLVEIPKYWYKWTRNINNQQWNMKLQIANYPAEGFYVSPAHADRGDGAGERDVVYVGSFLCLEDYKSTQGSPVVLRPSIANARANIHSLGSDIWQWDIAMYWTIVMLFLVEYRQWNDISTLGHSATNNSGGRGTGGAASAPYHTAHNSSSTSYTGPTKYRNINDLCGPYAQFVDGVYLRLPYSGATYKEIYCIKNPSDFGTSTGTYVGSTTGRRQFSEQYYIDSYTDPSDVNGFEYAMFPAGPGTKTTSQIRTCAWFGNEGNGSYMTIGDDAQTSTTNQKNMLSMNIGASPVYTSCRLMKLP